MKRISTKALTISLSMAVMFGAALTIPSHEAAAKKVKVKKVSVTSPSGKTVYVAKGKKVKLTPTVKVTPNKKANKKVTYKSANTKVATVNGKGYVKGVKPGKTKITVTSKKNKKKKATIKVVVKKAAVKKVKIKSGNFVLAVGGKKTLKASVSPAKNVSKKIAWSSSNKKVATVSSKGLVKAKKEGKAKITAKAADGSGKKASVKVTVGAGIASVSVPHSRIVRVALTSKKALNANNFVIQRKSRVTSKNYVALEVESVRTSDQKVYDVLLDDSVWENSYLRVTISALSVNKTKEIYVDKIADYGDAGNEEVEYVTGKVARNKYVDNNYYDYYISNSNAVGTITYTSLTGLPSGLKAYFNKTKTSVSVRGSYQSIEKGTTAVLTGVDEMGQTFSKKFIYYIGSDKELVAYAKPARTELAYVADDPKTDKDEKSGWYPDYYDIRERGGVAGGSGEYSYEVTWNGQSIDKLYRDDQGNYKSVAPGTYNFNVKVTDDENSALTTNYTVTYSLVAGVTLSGVVRDAANTPARHVDVSGATKKDAYGDYYSIYYESTEANGTYETRVVPGNYYLEAYDCDLSVNNVISANTRKDFKIPYYRVNFTTDIPGAKGYDSYGGIKVRDSYGTNYSVWNVYGSKDGDFGLYAYLKPGNYEFVATDPEDDESTVVAYSEISQSKNDVTGATHYYLSGDKKIGNGRYKVSGSSFVVNGNNTVVMHGVPFVYKDSDIALG